MVFSSIIYNLYSDRLNMLKVIATIFAFLVCLLTVQFVLEVTPHYKTRNYIPTSATIVEQTINSFNDYTYNINLVYSYTVDNRTYLNNHIQTEDLIFNNTQIAKEFLNSYNPGKSIGIFYNPNNYRESYLFRGLTVKDWNIFTLLCGLIISSYTLLYLSFIRKWQFNERNNSLPAIGFGLLGTSILGIICHFFIIFGYKLEANNRSLVLILFCYIITFLCSFVFQKITNNTLHKYYRTDMEEPALILHEDHDYTKDSKILAIKKQGLYTVLVINLLTILLLSFIWANHQFTISNIMLIIAMIAVFINLFYIYIFSLKTKKYYSHSFTQ